MATDFFTVLSTGQHFTEDQWLNVQAFSMLRGWLLHSPESPGAPDAGGPGGRGWDLGCPGGHWPPWPRVGGPSRPFRTCQRSPRAPLSRARPELLLCHVTHWASPPLR